jgi:hypothetical protein
VSLYEVKAAKIKQRKKIRKMTNRKLFVVGLALAFLTILPAARASEFDQATKLTFSQSVQVPGRVLPAGTYWFIAEPNTDSKIVQVFSEDRLTVYASILTVPDESRVPVDETAITFAQRGAMEPEAILTWFYPGRSIGHQFVYSKQQEKALAQNSQRTVLAGD